MVTAIVLSPSLGASAERAAEAVARSLAALVRASVEGIVRDAVIVGPAGDMLAEIANHAGCAFVEASSKAKVFRAPLARPEAKLFSSSKAAMRR